MRVAVVSDIHSNLARPRGRAGGDRRRRAGRAVVPRRPRRLRRRVRTSAVRRSRTRADVCLAGNHDLAVRGTIDLEEFSGDAAAAAAWTRDVLSPEARAYLDGLQPQGEAGGVALYHAQRARPGLGVRPLRRGRGGDARDRRHAARARRPQPRGARGDPPQRRHRGRARRRRAPRSTSPAGRFLLNPGSVGQPRDGDPRAAYLLLDLDARHASFRRVEYDIARTQSEIREQGLPESLALRLSTGQ